MKVLVTGGAGYIGSHAVLALLEANHEPVVLDNLSTGQYHLVPERVPFIKASVGSRPVVEQTLFQHGIDAVMHFAGSIVVPESVTNPLLYYRNNVVNSLSLIESCKNIGIKKFIFSSTAAVYGIPEEIPVVETAETRPINPYGATKLMIERILCDVAAAHELGVVILRYFNVAGADPTGRSGQSSPLATHLIKVACETALGKRSSVAIFGEDYPTPDGTGVRDYIHVSDLVDAHIRALEWLAVNNGPLIVNCGYGTGYSVRDVLTAVERTAGVSLPICHAPRRPGDPPALVADAQRIRDVLGWRPRYNDLDQMVASALAWEQRLSAESTDTRSF
jgi:UDP-glucose 4-epimerase